MDLPLLIKATLMGIVEGLTEFLPIPSTGHLILDGTLLGFYDEKAKVFDIAIQTGAILAVILVYWQKIRDTVSAWPPSSAARSVGLLGGIAAWGVPTLAGWNVSVSAGTIVLAVFLGFYPARRAANLLPIQALRYE